jgi:hypothetical protein
LGGLGPERREPLLQKCRVEGVVLERGQVAVDAVPVRVISFSTAVRSVRWRSTAAWRAVSAWVAAAAMRVRWSR